MIIAIQPLYLLFRSIFELQTLMATYHCIFSEELSYGIMVQYVRSLCATGIADSLFLYNVIVLNQF